MNLTGISETDTEEGLALSITAEVRIRDRVSMSARFAAMTSTLPPRRSLALLAFLAVVMIVLSYAVILLIAVACASIPILILVKSESLNGQLIVLALCGLAMAGTMLWSLVPRRDKFEDPRAQNWPRVSSAVVCRVTENCHIAE